jgi:putative endonuclease
MKSRVYVLKSLKDGNLYIGSTTDLDRRIVEHNSGKNRSTKNRRPFQLVYSEEFDSIKDARARERLFKKSHSILYKAANWEDKHK